MLKGTTPTFLITVTGGTQYMYTYSDAGYMIERDGVQYGDAIDPIDSGREYMESTIKIESEGMNNDEIMA